MALSLVIAEDHGIGDASGAEGGNKLLLRPVGELASDQGLNAAIVAVLEVEQGVVNFSLEFFCCFH
jgi:hypothetical protein